MIPKMNHQLVMFGTNNRSLQLFKCGYYWIDVAAFIFIASIGMGYQIEQVAQNFFENCIRLI